MTAPRLHSPQRIGVVSINPKIDEFSFNNFEKLYAAVGKNTGNLMFTQSMFSVLEGEVKQVGFSFDPKIVNENFDFVVVPAANWLNKYANWDWLLEKLEGLTIPVVVFGIGLQADSTNIDDVEVSDSALRLVKFFSEHAPAISVRGEFTKSWLVRQGVKNVVTTGCPSLYMNIFDTREDATSRDIVFQSTRYGISPGFVGHKGINRRLFSLCARFDMPMVYQSEIEEIDLLVDKRPTSELGQKAAESLTASYDFNNLAEFDFYLSRQGKVFFNLPDWSAFLRSNLGVIGTRLHGSIIALNSGRRAVLIPHDSRTAEVANFAGIPTINGPTIMEMKNLDDIRSVVEHSSLEKYKDTRSRNQARFVNFLNECGLVPNTLNMF